jgi:lipopolysaccharide/colanic/teichoic acid biosynthesis glycosyltransferase
MRPVAGALQSIVPRLVDAPARIAPARVSPRTRAGGPAVRTFDLLTCLLVLPLVVLVGAITALLIYIDSPGSVFYRSTRVGRGGKHSRCSSFARCAAPREADR